MTYQTSSIEIQSVVEVVVQQEWVGGEGEKVLSFLTE